MNAKKKLKSFFAITACGYATYSGACLYRGDEMFYKNYVMPIVHLLDAEKAHNLAVFVSQYRLLPRSRYVDPESLKLRLFNKHFSNPIGIAAGFDKDGKAIQGLQDMGFGFIEIGSVTPLPQPGNEKPRVFRLNEDKAVINRYGFNSEGHESVFKRIELLRKSNFNGIVGINLGKNKTSLDPIEDYVKGIKLFGPVADYLVINISSPNTPGLRSMQNKEVLKDLLKTLVKVRDSIPQHPPLLLKLAPDLCYEECKDIAEIVQQKDSKLDGLIISNTTIERPDSLLNVHKNETGGLSGKPLSDMSAKMIADMFKLTNGMLIIGVGGISNGKDAYEKIIAGATVVQIYTSMVYEGPPIVTKIKKELAEYLTQDGFNNISEAVGKAK